MSDYNHRKRKRVWFVGGIILLELIFLLVPMCRWGELWLLSDLSYGQLDHYFPTALGPLRSDPEPLTLSSYTNSLSVPNEIYPNRHTYLINTNTGSLISTVNQQKVLDADQHLYWTSLDNTSPTGDQIVSIAATRLSDNKVVWQHTFNPSPHSYDTQIQNGIFYFISQQDSVDRGPSVIYAFSEDSGTLLWQHAIRKNSDFRYIIKNNYIYILSLSEDKGVEAITASTGKVLWFQPLNVSSIYNIVADTTTVYTLGNNIQALRAMDGQPIWILTSENTIDPLTSPIYDYLGEQQGIFYVSTGHYFNAINIRTGKILWTHDLPYLGFRITGSTLYFSGGTIYWIGDRDIYAFHSSDGSPAWHFQGQNTTRSSWPAHLLGVLNGIVYVQLRNDLVALQSANGQKIWYLASASPTEIRAIMNGQNIYYGYAMLTSNRPIPSHWTISISQAYYYCSQVVNIFAIKSQNGSLQWQRKYTSACEG